MYIRSVVLTSFELEAVLTKRQRLGEGYEERMKKKENYPSRSSRKEGKIIMNLY